MTRAPIALAIGFAVTVAVPGRARADKATAEAAFLQAEQLAKDGKWAEACPFYEASYTADPALGALLHVADCHERIGKTATAWAEFHEAQETAHKKDDTKRETYAQQRADALAPKLAKLHLVAPKSAAPGLTITRDGADISVLIGTDMPIDPGDHVIAASAPGYISWSDKVVIAAAGKVTTRELPSLDKIPDKPVEPTKQIVHEGKLAISTQPDAVITIDSQSVGTGHYEGTIKSGGHTLRVTAKGMHTYQSEIVVADNDNRTIDVPLDKEAAVIVMPPAAPAEETPSFELAAGMLTGVKVHADKPLVVALRIELALRRGRRVNLGLFAELAEISTSGSCGMDMPGPTPTTPFDFGMRNQFNSCKYFMPGIQLMVHVLPKGQWDPIVGVTPAFRATFVDWTPYLGGTPQPKQSYVLPSVPVGIRAGLDYRPDPKNALWAVGAFFETEITIKGQEAPDNTNQGAARYVSMFGGLRSSLTF